MWKTPKSVESKFNRSLVTPLKVIPFELLKPGTLPNDTQKLTIWEMDAF